MRRPNIYLLLFITAVVIGIGDLWPNSFTQALVVITSAITVLLIIRDLLTR